MMNCRIFQTQLPDFVSGDAPSEMMDLLEQHLITCDSCRQEFETELECRFNLGNLPLVKCPQRVTTNILEHIGNEERDQKAGFRPWIWTASSLVAAGLALALLMPGTHEAPSTTYSNAEIHTATKEAQWALAKVATVINRSESNAFEQVFSQEISGAVGVSLIRITKNLQGEV